MAVPSPLKQPPYRYKEVAQQYGTKNKCAHKKTEPQSAVPSNILRRASYLSPLFLPMLKLRHHRFHMGSDLIRRPSLTRHMLHTEINQLFLAGIRKFSIDIAPFAVFLIERAVSLSTDRGIIQRHSTTLANQPPRRAQQSID